MEHALLDNLWKQMHCEYMSDLKFLSPEQKMELVKTISDLRVEDVDLDQWNRALNYLTGDSPKDTVAAAKSALLAVLQR